MISLPPNCTSVHQPIDQGIIKAVKKRYNYKLLSSILENITNREQRHQASTKMLPGTAGLNEGGEAHVIHVILHNVWNDMEASIIVHFYAKSATLTITIDADI